MEHSDALQALFRWAHIVAGVLWIGLLYYFNFVNGQVMGTLDKDTKQKVIPELMPRALYFFRWGAAWTWITGFGLLGLVYHMNKDTMFGAPVMSSDGVLSGGGWGPGAGIMVLLAFVGTFIYDALAKSPLGKKNQNFAILAFVLVAVMIWAFEHVGHLTYRATNIHVGVMFGTMMAFNVWYRIWPAQQKIIAAVKAGQAPDAALVALAGTRSRHNTYMSVPLIWTMINQHTVSYSSQYGTGMYVITAGVVAIGWIFVMWMYKKAGSLKGF